VKVTDDYKAKVRLWASNPTVVPLPAGPRIPNFKSKKFNSYAEMNEWKRALIRDIARGTATAEEADSRIPARAATP
jgi:hypothetical protein